MSERILASPWFLFSTAIVTGFVTAFTSWLAADSTDGVRLLAVLIGVGVGLGAMLLVAWALTGEETTRIEPVEMPPPATPPPPVARHDELDALLERGRALLEELAPETPDERVEPWIADVRETLERAKPGVVGYFGALGARTYTDDRARLDAYVTRLVTITRDFF
jgi:hypothetical protein